MAARSIASLSLTFGLVSVPVRLYSATESASAIKFKLMAPGGARVRQTYVAEALPTPVSMTPDVDDDEVEAPAPQRSAAKGVLNFPTARTSSAAPPEPDPIELDAPVSRSEMIKGYEFAKDQFVLFTDAELKALAEESRQTIDIVSFIPDGAVDPLYYDKPYFLVPGKGGNKTYSLLLRAMLESGRRALAKWAWRSKEYVVEVRPTEGGLVLQQLLYADEVRSIADLKVDLVPVSDAELSLAKQIIEQIAADAYDPSEFVDEEKQRILAAVDRKVAGKEIVTHGAPAVASETGQVLDLMAALRASLGTTPRKAIAQGDAPSAPVARKPAKKATAAVEPAKVEKIVKKSARR